MKKSVLAIINFSELDNWSIGRYFEKDLNSPFDFAKLSTFLCRCKEPVTVESNKKYKQITIHQFGEGVSLRCELYGTNIKTKRQFLAHENQFIVSRIDARNGSFGIVPKELENAIVTNDFWLFDVSGINKEYLLKLLSLEKIQNFWQSKSKGTTNRQRVNEEDFLASKIPVPTRKIQDELIAKYNKTINQAKNAEAKAEELENEIEEYLLRELGIRYNVNNNNALLQTVLFSKLSYWDIKQLNDIDLPQILLKSDKYPNINLITQYQFNPKTVIPENLKQISFLPMGCISDVYGEIISQQKIDVRTKGYTKFQENDVIFAKITPCMQNGKCAILKGLDKGYGYGSTEFYVFRSINPDASPEFLHKLLRTKLLRSSAMKYFTGSAGQQRVNSEFFKKLRIPFPTLEIQNQIVNHIDDIKSQIKELRQDAASLRVQAKKEFEESVFDE